VTQTTVDGLLVARDGSTCREPVCWCHDDTSTPPRDGVCSGCGCTWTETVAPVVIATASPDAARRAALAVAEQADRRLAREARARAGHDQQPRTPVGTAHTYRCQRCHRAVTLWPEEPMPAGWTCECDGRRVVGWTCPGCGT